MHEQPATDVSTTDGVDRRTDGKHKDAPELNLTMDQTTTIAELIAIDIIRDIIMDQLAPMDVDNFVIGTGIKFSKEDMERYMSIFKYIIPNRRWLQSKVALGYRFTIMSANLFMLNNISEYRADWVAKEVAMELTALLVVTKDGYTVPCTDRFMRGCGITNMFESTVVNTRRGPTPDPVETRVLLYDMRPLEITLVCITQKQDVKHFIYPGEDNDISPDMFDSDSRILGGIGVEYVQLNKDRSTPNRFSECKFVNILQRHPSSHGYMNFVEADKYSQFRSYRVHTIPL
jgi:hypothetical protein